MNSLWGTLVPIIIGSALVPVQVLITVLLLRSPSGRRTAVGFVAGLSVVRVLQGIVFGLILSSGGPTSADEHTTRQAIILLVLSVFFLSSGIRGLLKQEDPDAPPPKWLTMLDTVGPMRAFGFGIFSLALAPKFWVFTLGAISAIQAANLGRPLGIFTFLLFLVLAESVHLTVVGMSFAAPKKSAKVLGAVGTWLTEHNRMIVIVVSLVFGTWFFAKALTGLGLL